MQDFVAFFTLFFCCKYQSVHAGEVIGNDTVTELNPLEIILEHSHNEPISGVAILSRATVNTSWITQKLDHFNDSDCRTWQMRYKSNDVFFEDGGPILIFVGAEWEITDGAIKAGPIFDLAKEAKAYLYYTEHRYYGKSHPTKDLSIKNIKYLSVQQSLEDLAYFIKTMKATVNGLENSKVILVGGSLSAAMVAWFLRMYPDVAAGGWASSAPIKFKIDFYEYKEIVGEALEIVGGGQCYKRVQKAFDAIANGIKKKDKDMINKVLKLCPSFNPSDKNDVSLVFLFLGDTFGAAIQSHNSGDIERHCSEMLSTKDDVKGVASWVHSRLKLKKCLPGSYKAIVNHYKKIDWKTHKMGRQWYYQTCTQFGWFHTFNSEKQPFGKRVPMDFYIKFCSDIFGNGITLDRMENQSNQMNNIYGGLNPEVTNIYFTHGYLDPWRPLGAQNNQTFVKVLKGYAHCKDLKIRDDDTDEMLALRRDIVKQVLKWMN